MGGLGLLACHAMRPVKLTELAPGGCPCYSVTPQHRQMAVRQRHTAANYCCIARLESGRNDEVVLHEVDVVPDDGKNCREDRHTR